MIKFICFSIKNINWKLVVGIILFIATFIAFAFIFINHNTETRFPIYSNLENMKVLKVVDNPIRNKYVIQKYILSDCNIENAYLYIVASVADKAIDVDGGEDICFGINQKCKHIMMNNNKIAIPNYKENTYLYDLSNMALLDYNFETGKANEYYPNANLLDNMQTRTIEFVAKVSANKKPNTIEKLYIYYTCSNDCSIKNESCGIMPMK